MLRCNFCREKRHNSKPRKQQCNNPTHILQQILSKDPFHFVKLYEPKTLSTSSNQYEKHQSPSILRTVDLANPPTHQPLPGNSSRPGAPNVTKIALSLQGKEGSQLKVGELHQKHRQNTIAINGPILLYIYLHFFRKAFCGTCTGKYTMN